MLRKASAGKKKWINIGVAGVLTAAIVAGVTYNASETAMAKASLPGIEKITQANGYEDPFTILEIVPSYDKARMGYLVSGQEPAYYDSNKGVMSLADMASKEERKERYPEEETDFSSANHDFSAFGDLKGTAFSWTDKFEEGDDKTKSFSAYGSFEENTNTPPDGDYMDVRLDANQYREVIEKDGAGDADITIEKVLDVTNTDTTGILYMDDTVFTDVADPHNATGDRVNLRFSKFADLTGVTLPFKVPDPKTSEDDYYYNWSFYLTTSTSAFEAVEDKDENDDLVGYKFTTVIPTNTAIYEASTAGDIFYSGYTYTDTDDKVWFQPAGGGVAVLVEADKDTDSLAKNVFINSSLAYYTIKQYDSNNSEDSDRRSQRLYISDVTVDNTYGAVTQTLIPKNVIVKAGQDAGQFGVDINDDMLYHKFWYMENGKSDFKFDNTHSPKTGTMDFVQNYSGDVINTFKYDGGFTNMDWFKQFVLDREPGAECDNAVVNVVTKLAKDVTAADITNAKLVYIQGGTYVAADDIDKDVAAALLTSIYTDNKAVVIEGSGLYAGTSATPNLNKLCTCLQQPRISQGPVDDFIKDWDDATKMADYATKRVPDNLKKSYVIGTVFVYNDNTIDGVHSVVDPKFNQELRSATIEIDNVTLGYEDVIEDINNEKFYLSVSKDNVEFNDKVTIATCIRHILNFGDRRVTSKSKVRVLDIEPFYSQVMEDNTDLFGTYAYTLDGNGQVTVDTSSKRVQYRESQRDIFSRTWFKSYIGTQIKEDSDISVKGMGTREFIGNIEDLNSNYDLIYIGLDTQYLNTDFITEGDHYIKGTSTKYNNSDLNGIVYPHIGDDLYMNKQYGQGDTSHSVGTFKSSGNDITFEKLRELQSYVEAGYAVLFSTDFFRYNADGSVKEVNTKDSGHADGKIDPQSYMYDFAKWVIDKGYFGKNVNVKKNFDNSDKLSTTERLVATRETFSKYMSISKLEIEVIPDTNSRFLGYPVPYLSYDENGKEVNQYIAMNSSGNYSLDFAVRLNNDAATNRDETSYDCKLYIDHDADGRFEDPVESLNGISIVDADGNSAVFEDGVYKLTTDKIYYIQRNVPEGYVGFLAWKLVFYQNGRVFKVDDDSAANNLVRTSIQGYSAVPDFTNKPTINVLQITSGNNRNYLDLTDSSMVKLYEGVKDFNIDVTKVSANNFVNNPNNGTFTGTHLEYLMQYDMVVMGFDDMYRLPETNKANADKAVHAIRNYILAGKSMLFTHDLNSTVLNRNDNEASWGYLANMYLRDVQGMDRYGITKDHLGTLEASVGETFAGEYKSRYDNDVYNDIFGNTSFKAKKNGNLIDEYGWNTSTLMRYQHNTSNRRGYTDVSYYDMNNKYFKHDAANYTSTAVTRVNQGQITEYPYHIAEEISVATTHPQYFQLNLDTDSKDDNFDDDIVVWYTISNQSSTGTNYYTADFNDVRNNYYIYNKGNITYTGSGHSNVTGTDEKKLFVNTLVAAYNAGDHAPYVKYKESATSNAVNIISMHEPYDIDLVKAGTATTGGFLENTITVNFKTINNNLQNNTVKNEDGTYSYKTIHAQYYIEDPTASANFITIDGKKYRIITPVSITKKVDSNNMNLAPGVELTDKYTLENYCTYECKFNLSDIVGTSTGTDADGKAKLNLNSHNMNLYVRLSMDTPTVTHGDLVGMDANLVVLPATDSMSKLSINFTELYELN